ncbi:MAG: type II toxin-antitoxin system RelE/ParE family toxin [Thiomicrospira sp.]|jgi:putative addiction module killer protein|nr:type II toxin-antitoxin system RelE/ParE family toxin [Thiomicrospira sp.]
MEFKLLSTSHFDKWFKSIKDKTAKARITARLMSVQSGHFGDYKPLSENLFELRLHFASGYRIYYSVHQNHIILLLLGGDKSSQNRDIEKAKNLLNEWRAENDNNN